MNRPDLPAEPLRHRRSIRLVLRINIVPERWPFSVENNDELIVRVIRLQALQHADHAFRSTRIQSLAIRQRPKRMKGPKQLRGAINQNKA